MSHNEIAAPTLTERRKLAYASLVTEGQCGEAWSEGHEVSLSGTEAAELGDALFLKENDVSYFKDELRLE